MTEFFRELEEDVRRDRIVRLWTKYRDLVIALAVLVVAGTGLAYRVAGPGSRRIEDDARDVQYQGTWVEGRGNYSGGSIHWTASAGATVSCGSAANAGAPISITLRTGGCR